MAVSERCLIKLLPCILFDKYINILALEMASPGNQHCANCIGSFGSYRPMAHWFWDSAGTSLCHWKLAMLDNSRAQIVYLHIWSLGEEVRRAESRSGRRKSDCCMSAAWTCAGLSTARQHSTHTSVCITLYGESDSPGAIQKYVTLLREGIFDPRPLCHTLSRLRVYPPTNIIPHWNQPSQSMQEIWQEYTTFTSRIRVTQINKILFIHLCCL